MCYKNEYQKRAHGEVEQIFRELLPEAGLHVREEQIRLCHEMLDALMKNEITLCDAGVGIGKTYAYLTACILMRKYSVLHSGYSGCDRRSVVVSTSSIALQKAIIEEYVPFLSDVLLKADLLQGELKAVVRKGKEHFVCDYRLAQRLEAVRDKNKNQAQMEALKSLRHNFDLDSVHNLSGFDRRLVCVPKFCPRECPGKVECRYQKHLDSSRKEDIFLQICNHNYLLADGVKLTELHVDDWTIAKLLGHKGVRSVQYYRKMSNQRMADETREVRNFMSQIILASLDGWGEEYEQIRQDAGIE